MSTFFPAQPFACSRTTDSPAPADGATPTLAVLYRDDALLVVHKPSGLLVHRSALDAHAVDWALQAVRRQTGAGRLYPVHRLDRATSGVLIFALTPEAHRAVSDSFAHRSVHKTYLAIVRGWPPALGCIDAPLARIDDGARGRAVTGEPQPAQTRFRCLATVELPVQVDRYPTSRYALVELEPLTGRRHQLRRHLRKIDHPIVGDTTYGQARHNRLFRSQYGVHRLLLAAVEVSLVSPASGERVTIVAPPAADFWSPLVALGFRAAVPARWCPAPDPL